MTELLHDALDEAADRYPGAIAIVDGDLALTYRQLQIAANHVAHELVRIGVRRGERVGLYLHKSAQGLAALYGVLKAGAAYVPLAADWPIVRVKHIIADAGIGVLITGLEQAGNWPELTGRDAGVEHLICVNGRAGELPAAPGAALTDVAGLAKQPDTSPPVAVGPGDLAYVLYTSGSTGGPKGVMLTHRNGLSFVDWAVAEFAVTRNDRLASHAPLHFDLSVFDLFAAARAAAPVVLVPKDAAPFPPALGSFVRDSSITVWYSVPSAVNMLASRAGLQPGDLPALRLVLFAGEVFPVSQLRKAMAAIPGAEFCNLYGPTETNVCTCYRVPRPLDEHVRSLPLGQPIDGVQLFCRTDDGRAAAENELGELWVSGPTVMAGYLGHPERTGRALGPPDPAHPDAIAYRTGDLASQDAAGLWHFAGRRDSQIKSRGYRIELGEIETVLNGHPAVIECAVTAAPDEAFGNRIDAYVVVGDGLGPAELTAYSRKSLPSYMVPWSFAVMPALPRTSTGKIDYQELKSMG
jgi:amino acid adenylation domain-containing protein